MKKFNNPPRSIWSELILRPQLDLEYLDDAVKKIISEVKTKGDQAIRDFTLKFDQIAINDLLVSEKEISEAQSLLSAELINAIDVASKNIEKFHAAQIQDFQVVETMPGVDCWRKAVAIEKVGLYIPGGSAPLFSTVLMLGIPARLAGCKEVILCTPPDKDGKVNPAILFAAFTVGIRKIFKVGGAQAIAAMASGTETIPKAYKIFGPGNQFVTKAKQLVNQSGTAIDMPAGPSEVLVIADDTANASFVASDLLAQAEHGADSQVVLLTFHASQADQIEKEIKKQLPMLPRQQVASKALEKSLQIIFDQETDAIDFVNEYAPEHLILNTKNCDALAEKIINSGSVFIGQYSPESAGDYASGTNHTLPTGGHAKAYAGVSLESFTKKITFQKITAAGLKIVGPAVEKMAEAEQLIAHKESVSIRLKSLK